MLPALLHASSLCVCFTVSVFQGAPARGAVVLVEDKSGRWQKRAIDAGRLVCGLAAVFVGSQLNNAMCMLHVAVGCVGGSGYLCCMEVSELSL